MVKSGESYFKTESADVAALSERPRNIFVPSKEGCGFLTYIQQYIFWDFKSKDANGWTILPEFVHGLNSCSLKDRIKELLGESNLLARWCVSMDGSAFDSN